MKTLDSGLWQGANRSDSQSYCEDEQRRHGTEGAFSCAGTCEAHHYIPGAVVLAAALAVAPAHRSAMTQDLR